VSTNYVARNGSKPRNLSDAADLSRLEAVEMARLRTGASTLIRSHQHKIRLCQDARCTDCDLGVVEDLCHLFACPARGPHRIRCFGTLDITPAEALRKPCDVVRYLRALGKLGGQAGRPQYRH
jgi:hypothetical protein